MNWPLISKTKNVQESALNENQQVGACQNVQESALNEIQQVGACQNVQESALNENQQVGACQNVQESALNESQQVGACQNLTHNEVYRANDKREEVLYSNNIRSLIREKIKKIFLNKFT